MHAAGHELPKFYPVALCKVVARAMGLKAGLKPVGKQGKLRLHDCAHCAERVGEASNPGPRARRADVSRDPSRLLGTALVEPVTQKLQLRLWSEFEEWLFAELSASAAAQVFLCAPLAVQWLRRYGLHLYSKGRGLYELRHVLVLAQQRHPALRPVMSPAWQLVTQWEELHPLQHRQPLHEILFRAMFVVAVWWGWRRFAGLLLLGMEGIARIGELLRASRADLVLPSDLVDTEYECIFMKVRKPKSLRRGKGRVQHIRVDHPAAIPFIEDTFGKLSCFVDLFPLSASAFRTRWDRILGALRVPISCRPTPSSIRGGGAILAYRRGEAIQNILWRMRLTSQKTLESYLQELAADSALVSLPEVSKQRIRSAASLYTHALKSPGF